MTLSCEPTFESIVRHYENCLANHGATPHGVDWPNGADLAKRFEVMLGVRRPESGEGRRSFLDVGCGPGLLVDYLNATGRAESVDYCGFDMSDAMVRAARDRWPDHRFLCADIRRQPNLLPITDYVVLNGVLTEKRDLSQTDMAMLACELLDVCFSRARIGMAFNVMSTHVDWMRDDLFHWPMDEAVEFATRRLSRHVVVRADYGLYEYTLYVYRQPTDSCSPGLEETSAWWKR